MPCGSLFVSGTLRLRSTDLSDVLLSRFDFFRSACVNRPVVGLLLFLGVRPVHDDLDALQSYESATDHFVQLWKDLLDLLFGVDAFDDDRKIERQLQESRRMNATARAEAHDSPGNSRSGVVTLSEQLHYCPVQRLALVLVPLADVDSHQHPLTLQAVHFSSFFTTIMQPK